MLYKHHLRNIIHLHKDLRTKVRYHSLSLVRNQMERLYLLGTLYLKYRLHMQYNHFVLRLDSLCIKGMGIKLQIVFQQGKCNL